MDHPAICKTALRIDGIHFSVECCIYLHFLVFGGFLQVTTSTITRAIMMRSMITAPAAMAMVMLRGSFMMAVVVSGVGNKVHMIRFMMHSLKGRIVQPPKTGLKCTSAAALTL